MTLVLLPGLDGTGLLFADFAAFLGPEVRVVVASYPTETPLSYAELELLVRAVLPIDESFFLLAESFSGPIGIAIAASPPPGLLGLILCCSFACNPLPALAPFRFGLAAVPVAAVPLGLLSFFLLGRFATPKLRATLSQALKSVAPAVLRARAQAVLSVDVSSLLSRLKVSVFYLRAIEDRIVPKSSSELIASLVPHAKMLEFEAPHFLLQAVPSLAASAVKNFIRMQTEPKQPCPRDVGPTQMPACP